MYPTFEEQVELDKAYYTKRINRVIAKAKGYAADGRTVRLIEAVKEAHRTLGILSALCGLSFEEYSELFNRIPTVKQ